MPGRKPDYRVKALERGEGGKSAEIGAGWKNEDGSVSITLNVGVGIRWTDDLIITAFPVAGRPETEKPEATSARVRFVPTWKAEA